MDHEVGRVRRLRMLHPLRRRGELQRRRFRRGVYLLPSLFTLANMFCGYACVVYSMRGEIETAAPFIGLAIILDMLDGRIARLTGTTSAFGVEFDSLADVISFGMAPAILTFQWGLHPLGRLGWAAGFLFVTAAAIRLARFNIQQTTDKRYFVGMPSPAAAAVPASTVYMFPQGFASADAPFAFLALALVAAPAFLMVSTLRFHSFKTIDLHSRRSPKVLFLFALGLVAFVTHPRWTLVAVAYTYLVSAFIGWAIGRWRRKPGDAASAAGAAGAAEGSSQTVPSSGKSA
jgi:CDP-diacylglycerol--serine O-phosphatidyltransferase